MVFRKKMCVRGDVCFGPDIPTYPTYLDVTPCGVRGIDMSDLKSIIDISDDSHQAACG